MTGNLQPRLLSILQREIDSLGFKPTTSCKSQMDQMVIRGIVRMRIGKALDNPGRILQAERSLRDLVQYFCDQSRDAGTFPEISDEDFRAALISCPPLWPYCG
jgi:hypothetical protein